MNRLEIRDESERNVFDAAQGRPPNTWKRRT